MCAAYAVFTTGFGGSALLAVACLMTGIARGGNNNFCSTMMSTLPRKKSAIGYNLLHGAFAMGAVISPLALILCTANREGGRRSSSCCASSSLFATAKCGFLRRMSPGASRP